MKNDCTHFNFKGNNSYSKKIFKTFEVAQAYLNVTCRDETNPKNYFNRSKYCLD